MTEYPTEAVELLARKLATCEGRVVMFDSHRQEARAILDALAPLLTAPAVAAEREACAKVADARTPQKNLAAQIVARNIAAAIRERSRQ